MKRYGAMLLAVSLLLVSACDGDGDDVRSTYTERTATSLEVATTLAVTTRAPTTRTTVRTTGTTGEPNRGPGMTAEQREAKVYQDSGALHTLLDNFWSLELRKLYGLQFDPPDRFEWYRGSRNSPCGRSNRALPNNAYYCEVDGDEYVAFDLTWLAGYLERFPGGATTFLVIAHEWGHAVQDTWLESGGRDVWQPAYRKELNADCLAGVFLGYAIRTGQVIEQVGDADAIWSWLYSEGGPWLNPTDHGTREQRIAAFTDGLSQGTNDCRVRY